MRTPAPATRIAILLVVLGLIVLAPLPAHPEDTVDGITIPPGLENSKDELEKQSKFAKDSAKCYRDFLDQKKAVDEKKTKGAVLTDAEKEIDGITKGNQMEEWATKCLERLGYKPKVAATTDAFGQVDKKEKADRSNPQEAFDEDLTELHESSHVDAAKKDAEAVGLDWEKWKKHGELKKKFDKADQEGKKMTDAELGELIADLRWASDNQQKIKAFLARRSDPKRAAEEEIHEYEKEISVYEKVLKLLEQRVKDQQGSRQEGD